MLVAARGSDGQDMDLVATGVRTVKKSLKRSMFDVPFLSSGRYGSVATISEEEEISGEGTGVVAMA